ncbi:DUF1214 domain-containing protein [Bradyrhizobium sp. 521_C7_N1_3]|uniref:DUF1214 domain-containing protein n=1 Tax=Bradyrhizobium sp. 521_C7_N1_3 TaxID=3240368 RepID=UPI003F8999AF
MGGRNVLPVRRRLLRPLHRLARRERQDAANVPCEANVQCRDGSLTLCAGAKITERTQESNWLPASGQFSLCIRAYGAPLCGKHRPPARRRPLSGPYRTPDRAHPQTSQARAQDICATSHLRQTNEVG